MSFLSERPALNLFITPFFAKQLRACLAARKELFSRIQRPMIIVVPNPNAEKESVKDAPPRYDRLIDEITHRVLLAPGKTFEALSKNGPPIFFAYIDGKHRKFIYRFLENLAQSDTSGKLKPVATLLGGSVGLGNLSMLGDKLEMEMLFKKGAIPYIPWTRFFSTSSSNWQNTVRELLIQESDSNNPIDVILKPAAGLKQRGLLLCVMSPDSFDLIVAHAASREHEGGPYVDWVMQAYVKHPKCFSGAELGQVSRIGGGSRGVAGGDDPDGSNKGGGGFGSTTAGASLSRGGLSSLDMKDAGMAQPGLSVPSDSGHPINKVDLYKVHFRIYALVTTSPLAHPGVYALYMCRFIKVYHASEPYQPNSLDPASGVSKYYALRLGNDFLDPGFTATILHHAAELVRDCVGLALKHGGFALIAHYPPSSLPSPAAHILTHFY
jgi:hypothetical protein